ncbi:hypothetical protein ACJA23_02660 [Mycoplasma corogypsi]|uniref:hypothetical protein n=1 Tax=Mycoplasma corogypsi TaxID=2106 RepID=UPI003872CAE1
MSKKITFKSIINYDHSKEEQVIEFTAPVSISQTDEFPVVFDFVEPSNQVRNMFEISDNLVNIIAGSQFITLKKDQLANFPYSVSVDNKVLEMILQTRMYDLVISPNHYEIKYELYILNDSEKTKTGDFHITLKISE